MSDAGLPAVTGNEIAIVAMAGRFPGARDVEAFWRNLREGVESIRFFTEDEMAAAGLAPEIFRHPAYVPARGVIGGADEIDAELFGLSAAEARATDPQQRIFLECCWEALERAGYDSERFRRPIGVYAGVGASGYGFHVYADSALVGAVGEFQALLGNDKDYLASRVAYKLDLTGPAVVIQTACSTSLVAIHFACQGLLTGECDLALAGGVAIKFPQEAGYVHREGGIGSPDGHCRAFDAAAQGTVGSSGAGVLVLKRLEDVAADGDQVLAVIRGSAVNNDGGSKIGYTAPAIEGQSRVVRLAHAVAEVDPATIGYVETHGTGTALGDPIEIAALEQAFRSGGCEGRGSCAIGSVKTNIGHLDTAAGVAGVIKTVQALRYGEIPPSLHFDVPNPEIPFAESCFRVNGVLSPWKRAGGPRRAGVSSFGIGGTNAHVVLEEAPPRLVGEPAAGPHLLVLAARTDSALAAATERLADHLAANPDTPLADAAYTLQIGRRRFAHRRAFLVEEGTDPAAALRTPDPQRSWSRTSGAVARPVVFLLPGQGSQHVGMARGLYAAEPAFRESFDRCAAVLEPLLGLDLRESLWPPGAEQGDTSAEARLRRSDLAQPTLFAVEYSLARLWMAWGVRPSAMIGHSVGELVAACLAGTFEVDDALRLVVLRGRLVQRCSPGDMVGVSKSEEEVRRYLPQDGSVHVAVVNGPAMVVLAGPGEAIAGVESALAADGVATRRLHTSHAFHCPAMEPAVEPFVEAVAEAERAAPDIPFFSNVTGRRVTPEEATDPAYWGRHLRETVRFGDALAAALSESDAVILEVGPGNVLGTLARRHPDLGDDRPVISSLGHARDREDDRVTLYAALARLWLTGVPIDWDGVHGARRRRVLLPTYPFERHRYTVRPGAGVAPGSGARAAAAPPSATDSQEVSVDVAVTSADTGAGRPNLDTPYVAPSGELEAGIATIWEELLGVAPIGRHDDFFELGGHSLLAIQVATRLGERTRRRVSLQSLLEHPTVAELAERVAATEEGTAEDAPETVRLEPDPQRLSEPFPLTDLQQAYWIGRGEDVELGGVSTHVYLELDTVGLDLERLGRALDRLVARHDMLRAVVEEDGLQRILAEVPPYRIATLDLRGVGEASAEEALLGVREAMSHQVLPADRWPLFEIRATLRSRDVARIHVSFDFLIGDAWSWRLLNLELIRLYLDPDAGLPPITISFRDYVLAERALQGTEVHRRALEHWRGRLTTLPPAPELPRAFAARTPAATGRRFTRRSARLDAEAWESLRQRGARRGLTPSGLVAAAFCEILAAWSRRSRFTLNLTQFNRQPLHPEVGSLVGDFTSVLLVAVDGSEGGTFEDRARRVQASLWEGLQHRAVTGVQVLRELARVRGTGAVPTMPVVFTSILNLGVESEDQDAERRFADRVPEAEVVYSISQTPQVLLDHQASERGGALFYNWDAVDEVYPPGLLDDMFAAYGELLARLAGDDEAWKTRESVRGSGAVTIVREPEPEAPARNLLELLDGGREASEDRVAIVAGDRVITHGGLARRARRLAGRLVEIRETHKAGSSGERERPVAVVMEKGWEQVVAVAAILEAGAPYLPIDARLPAERIRTLLSQGGARIALTQERFAGEIDWPLGEDAVTRLVVPLREEGPAPERPGPGPRAGAHELAYVLFTSGSTGVPKGVMIEHRAAANTILDIDRRYAVGADDRVLGLSSLSFDLSVYDLFGPLAAGGAIVLPEPDAARDPSRWIELLETGRVTLWNSVPALLEMLVEHAELDGRPLPASLRTVLLSGDWLPVKLPDRLRAAAPGPVAITSLGGATEASIWSVLFPVEAVEPTWPSIPYGRGMERQRLEVLSDELEPRPVWATGEIFIAGAGLARGYWRDPVRTATSFLPHPITGERLYRTGDLGRWLPSGDIEFLGREDTQVKVGGHRIELGEIEAVLARHPAVAACAVVAHGEPTRRRLVAYVVPGGDEPAGNEALSDHLASKLPAHMVPPTFVRLEALPLTVNGKVDRSALPRPDEAPGGPRRPPSTPVERALAAIWSELLDVAEPGADDSFFELGGDSVLTLQLVGRAAREGIRITASQVFRNQSLAEMAAGSIDLGEGAAAMPASDGPVPVTRDGELPLSFGQERLWFLGQFSETPVQNIPAALRLRGDLDPAVLASALSAVVRRHEALRTAFPAVDGVPRQVIARPRRVPLPVIDLRSLPEAVREVEVRRRALDAGRHDFDLTRPPLLWAELLRLGAGEHVLTCTVAHVVSDGWSMAVLVHEVAALYAARVAGRPSALPELPIQYADFAVWQRRWLAGESAALHVEFWRRKLAGFETLELPIDRPRPARGAFRGGTRSLDISPARTAGFREVLERHGATLFAGCLGLLAVLLYRLTGRTDLVIGADVAERDREELEGLIGLFVNQLVLRLDLSGDPGLGELLERIRGTVGEAFDHGGIPFQRLVEALKPPRRPGEHPFFQVKLVLQAGPRGGAGVSLPGIETSPYDLDYEVAQLDLILFVWERDDTLRFSLQYARDLFDPSTADRMARLVDDSLGRLVSDEETCLSSLRDDRGGDAHQEKKTMKAKFGSFKSIQPKSVDLSETEAVSFEASTEATGPARVARPAGEGVDLAEWAATHRERLAHELARDGAILFRGFGVDTPEKLERFAGAVCGDFFSENGEHVAVTGNVYTPVFYAPEKQLLWHNENSFNHAWPSKIWFACAHPAAEGGETPVVDSREVYERLPAEVREPFEEKGVMYVRNYGGGLGLDWRTVFQTEDRAEVERSCERDRFELEWRDGDRLRTRCVRPAVVRHPTTGEPCWFNQAQHFHVACLDPETRESLASLLAPEDFPRACYFGDGSEIPDAFMQEILDVYRAIEVAFPWQRGDVMLVDNIMAAHGRNPFRGERKILVTMGDMMSYDEIASV